MNSPVYTGSVKNLKKVHTITKEAYPHCLTPPPPDWIQGYTSIALVAEVFMFPISFSPLIMEQILWNGRLHRCPDLLV